MMENSKKQIVHVHGGDAFREPEKLYEMLRSRSYDPFAEKKRWRDAVAVGLVNTHDCIAPRMPNANWADYTAWSIWFEKILPYLTDNVVFVGHSLGGGFLLRYFTERKLPVRIAQLHLVAPVVTDGLSDTDGFTTDIDSWTGFASQIGEVHLWHSEDDEFVPMNHSERLAAAWPEATLHTLTDRGHFLQPEFPELLAEIQKAL